jgi:hypothetical protein
VKLQCISLPLTRIVGDETNLSLRAMSSESTSALRMLIIVPDASRTDCTVRRAVSSLHPLLCISYRHQS